MRACPGRSAAIAPGTATFKCEISHTFGDPMPTEYPKSFGLYFFRMSKILVFHERWIQKTRKKIIEVRLALYDNMEESRFTRYSERRWS